MAFLQEWIDSTVHCVDVTSLVSVPTSLGASEVAVFTASIKTSDTFVNAGSIVTLTQGDGSAAITGIVTGPVDGVYTATFNGVSYAATGVYQALVNATTDSGLVFEQQFSVVIS